ncbi:arginine/ornithine antiporter [Spiroplasma corruscae]|uniref:Arginine/ornithine antiporter n=1 Tax=Spiroplasma corruscae TaxID=216934 RepID=A0A222EMU0_9MOLU|nr:TRAP transporter large permease subunit [Spiroplasma corruscae]ASP27830.1 arginine/ornithine antiporter [Spiroplasma corruscae]
MENFKNKKKFKWRIPTAFTILISITLLLILISWIPGTTSDWTDTDGTIQKGGPAGLFDLFIAPINGLKNKIDVVIYILIIGGFLGVVVSSKALDAGIGRLVKKMKGRELLIIPIVMILFSIGGTVFGMCEETIALYPVLIPVLLAAGFDVITTILAILFGAGIGVVCSTINPFVIQIAVDNANVSGLKTSTGIILRIISWLVLTSSGIAFVMWYAIKVKNDPKKSPVYEDKDIHEKLFAISQDIPKFTKKRKAILAIFSVTFIIMIFSLIAWNQFGLSVFETFTKWVSQKSPYIARFYNPIGSWNFLETSALFLLSSIVIGFIEWKGEEDFVESFIKGSSDILSVCLVIAFAGGIGFIMEHTGMQKVLVNSLSSPMRGIGKYGFIVLAFLFFLLISVFIPSTSGFATAVFPVLGPIANSITIGLTSGTITAFSFANGIINVISPTSATLMAVLSLSKVSYGKFIKASWPLICSLIFISIIILLIGVSLPLSNESPWF